jgi:hypothetical protein
MPRSISATRPLNTLTPGDLVRVSWAELVRMHSLPVCIDGVSDNRCSTATSVNGTAGWIEIDAYGLSGACCTSAPLLEPLADTDAMMPSEAEARIVSGHLFCIQLSSYETCLVKVARSK